MTLENLKFKFNQNKLEFLNTNQYRKKENMGEIFSIRFGQKNKSLIFFNYKDKSSERLKLEENQTYYYFTYRNIKYFIPKSELINKHIIQFRKQ